jgi:YidC/Oxa1 family membrane protein insertase
MGVEIASTDPGVERVSYTMRGSPALPREGVRADYRNAVFGRWVEGRVERVLLTGSKIDDEEAGGVNQAGSDTVWAGQLAKYFAVVMIPQEPSPNGTFAGSSEAFRYSVTETGEEVKLAGVRLVAREQEIAPGEPVRNEYLVFAGPKEPDMLQQRYGHIGLEELVVWRSCCLPGTTAIGRVLLRVLEFFHGLVGNWGVAIMMLVLGLRAALHPVTRWSTKSMAKMQELGPKMQVLREEFGDDKQKLNQEMMALYKAEGINPVGGCLPMFIQMPIWVGLYGALMVAIQLRHAAFLPAWMVPEGSLFLQDLAQPDTLVHWETPIGTTLPLFGRIAITRLNVLPLLMAASIYLQQRLTPQPAAASQQASQQKMLMIMMPAMLLIFLYNAPAGLTLYIFTSTIIGFFEQRYLKSRYLHAKHPAGEPKEPPKASGKKSLAAGKRKSLAERAESWLEKRIAPGGGPGRKKK